MRRLAVYLTVAALGALGVVPHAGAASDQESVTGHAEVGAAVTPIQSGNIQVRPSGL